MYRANLFQKNIASNADSVNIDLVNSFNHALVDISTSQLTVNTTDGRKYTYLLKFSEQEPNSITYLGRFENGTQFRFIQRKGASLEVAKAKFGANGSFTLSSINPTGWAIHFYTTTENDVRNSAPIEHGVEEQIQKLIEGSLMALQFGMPEKFVELSKRLLPLIEGEPSKILKFAKARDFTDIMKNNTELYTAHEKQIIHRI